MKTPNKVLARQRINVQVRLGKRPHPNTLPCASCGHVWKEGERRHEYDHHKGYEPENHYEVQALCTKCHAKKDGKANVTACVHGHPYTPENIVWHSGRRSCRACRQLKDRGRRDAQFWRDWRKRRAENGRKDGN